MTAMRAQVNRRPPLPPPLRPWRVLPALAAGVVGTGLMYQAATAGGGGRLAVGASLFGLGLLFAGYPFVLASAWRRRARRTLLERPRPAEDD